MHIPISKGSTGLPSPGVRVLIVKYGTVFIRHMEQLGEKPYIFTTIAPLPMAALSYPILSLPTPLPSYSITIYFEKSSIHFPIQLNQNPYMCFVFSSLSLLFGSVHGIL